jgi:hypothetical protein
MLPDDISILLYSSTSGGLRKMQGKKYIYKLADLRAAFPAIHHCITKKGGHKKA